MPRTCTRSITRSQARAPRSQCAAPSRPSRWVVQPTRPWKVRCPCTAPAHCLYPTSFRAAPPLTPPRPHVHSDFWAADVVRESPSEQRPALLLSALRAQYAANSALAPILLETAPKMLVCVDIDPWLGMQATAAHCHFADASMLTHGSHSPLRTPACAVTPTTLVTPAPLLSIRHRVVSRAGRTPTARLSRPCATSCSRGGVLVDVPQHTSRATGDPHTSFGRGERS